MKGMKDVEVGGIAGKEVPPGVQLDERPEGEREGRPHVLEGGAGVVVQVPEDETGQVAQEGGQVELGCIGVAKPPQGHCCLGRLKRQHTFSNWSFF